MTLDSMLALISQHELLPSATCHVICLHPHGYPRTDKRLTSSSILVVISRKPRVGGKRFVLLQACHACRVDWRLALGSNAALAAYWRQTGPKGWKRQRQNLNQNFDENAGAANGSSREVSFVRSRACGGLGDMEIIGLPV